MRSATNYTNEHERRTERDMKTTTGALMRLGLKRVLRRDDLSIDPPEDQIGDEHFKAGRYAEAGWAEA
jgi:hypothetical protein